MAAMPSASSRLSASRRPEQPPRSLECTGYRSGEKENAALRRRQETAMKFGVYSAVTGETLMKRPCCPLSWNWTTPSIFANSV
jgi:hypothetical protein